MSLTNHCLNSAAAVKFAINKELEIDNTGFYALRQAEISCRSYEQDLFNFELDIKRRNWNKQKILNRIQILNSRKAKRNESCVWKLIGDFKDWVYKLIRLPRESDELFDLEQSLAQLQKDEQNLERDYRDAQMLLKSAQEARDNFYQNHPEFKGIGYQEIQEILTEQALLNRIAASFASNAWAGQYNLAARELLELNPTQIQYILKRESEFRSKLEGHDFNTQLYQLLSDVRPEEREQILLATMATVRQAKLLGTHLSNNERPNFCN